jgi:serine/threonine protein phosphatase PrpC
MTGLSVSFGQYSDKGRKPANQDCHGLYLPDEPLRTTKGIAVALADGIGSSSVSHVASDCAVRGFLSDYFSTPDTWSVKQSASRVLMAINAWLYAQTRQSQFRYDMDRGYVCTLSALVLRGGHASLFHAGDSRIYRWRAGELEQLTTDHRLWVSREQHYLSRALGIQPHLELDYLRCTLAPDDVFLLVTDGVYEYLGHTELCDLLRTASALDDTAERIAAQALAQGSDDNVTVQLLRVETLPPPDATTQLGQAGALPCPPALAPRTLFEGYALLRELHQGHRSHVYLARDEARQQPVVIKVPSTEGRDDPAWLQRFVMEEWIARRIDHPHVLRAVPPTRPRRYCYTVTEYIDGQTLRQWLYDHPAATLNSVRDIVRQIASGLRAFHRLEMFHQDLRPDNILIDSSGTVTLIDFGATRIAGLQDQLPRALHDGLLGTAPYTAPECFRGHDSHEGSDLFSLGIITYQLLTGQLPYGTAVAAASLRGQSHRLRYRPLTQYRQDLPPWIDGPLRKAVHPDPNQRYAVVSEFLFDLAHPNPALHAGTAAPLLERNPVLAWQLLSLVLALALAAVLTWYAPTVSTERDDEAPPGHSETLTRPLISPMGR